MTSEFVAVTDMLTTYFDGLYHSDTSRLRRVFHPDARYVSASDDPILNLGMPEYFAIVEKRPSPASTGERRRDRIASIAFAGPTAAIAQVNCGIGPKYFTDLLSLIKVDGKWRIIAKVFHYDVSPDTKVY